jgi:hypothetical protein
MRGAKEERTDIQKERGVHTEAKEIRNREA